MRKPFLTFYAYAVTAKLISAFVFATHIVQSLYFLNKNLRTLAILWLYSLVCVGPGREPRRLVISKRGSHYTVGQKRLLYNN